LPEDLKGANVCGRRATGGFPRLRGITILGMSTAHFTLLHTIISVIAIVSGFIVLGGLYAARRLPGWTELFLVTTALTSISGFFLSEY
jgi:hypothetical protein